jgi:hypothetical protein
LVRGEAAALALRAAGALAALALADLVFAVFAFAALAELFLVVARIAMARPRFGVAVASSLLMKNAPF